MTKINKILFISLIIVLVIISFNIIKSKKTKKPVLENKQTVNSYVSQENEGGNVTVTVKPKILKVGGKPAFELEFETHSVDLSFDVIEQSYLVDDEGNRFDNGIWEGSPPGGHHRSGTLSFNNSLTQTNYVELIISNVAGVSERKFKWNL